MHRIIPKIFVLLALFLLHSCAGTPPISELRRSISNVTFIQHGAEPLSYAFGVVDSDAAKKAATVTEVMSDLYNNHPLVSDVSKSIMPQLAQIWRVPYRAGITRIIQKGAPLRDAQGNLTGIRPSTDLVLVVALDNLTLTEKKSFGRTLAAGFTLGTNTKKVSAETAVTMLAYKRDLITGQYKSIWTGECQGSAQASKIDYPFPEVIKSKEKAKELWDAATPVIIEACSKTLEAIAKKG